ncbi:MAG: hypothetical protein Q9M29_08740 [Mariprofundaceae bacterium]|nr:hypothetical protein [Mariprofundaceae bacterium]
MPGSGDTPDETKYDKAHNDAAGQQVKTDELIFKDIGSDKTARKHPVEDTDKGIPHLNFLLLPSHAPNHNARCLNQAEDHIGMAFHGVKSRPEGRVPDWRD